MKRVGNILEAIAELENLRLAFWKAARGKGDRPTVQRFRANLAVELERMREGILREDYPLGRFPRFVIHDPKERVIHAAAFAERVLHHALMNVCEPHFERWLIHDTYACRRGKGQWAAVRRAEAFAGRMPFFLEPRNPRWGLEQQREQLPVGQTQQEQPGEPEQQPGIPRGPSSGRSRTASRN